jgi:large subunit ribosomal protein L25
MHSLEAKIRNAPALETRASGAIPGVVYGKDVPSTSIAVGVSEFVKIFRVLGKGETLTLTLEKKTYTVRLQESQRHPVSGAFLHLDFVIA